MTSIRARFAAEGARRAATALGGWLAAPALARGADAFLEPLWERHDAPALAERFFEARPVAGARPADYATRLLDTPSGPLLAGIRFKGGDMAKPFVEVATAFPLDAGGLAAARAAMAAFAVFSPSLMRLWRFADEAPPPGAVADQLLYAAPIAELRARALPPGFTDMVVGPAFGLGRLAEIEAAYAALSAADPVVGAEAGAADAEELQACLDQGLLFDAHVEWDWAGAIAGREAPFFGVDGVLVVEEILTAPFRGRGLGVCLQRHLIERLMPAGGAMLHGTIHALNVASRRTAERCGRRAVMVSEFVPIAHP